MAKDIRVNARLEGREIHAAASISGQLAAKADLGQTVIQYVGETNPYVGEYSVTPSADEQVLFTRGKYLTENVVVGAIPSNYGLITWNGATLTVS